MTRICAGGTLLVACAGPLRWLQSTPFALFEGVYMAKMCEVCGKAPVFGNRVSHAHNVSSRRWLPNLQKVRVMVGSAVKRMQVCTRCIRSGSIQKAVR